MKKLYILMFVMLVPLMVGAKGEGCGEKSQETKDKQAVQRQQSQYAARQPVPSYNWSLERELVRKLYDMRNQRVSTHSVWRSDYGTVEGDCASMGYGLPYDTSITNPLQSQRVYGESAVAIGQAEPNGVFASTNTSATWVICVGPGGRLQPVYVESKVTVYPGPIDVNYETNRVTVGGGKMHSIKLEK